MDQALTKQKIKELRALVGDGDRVAIVLQDDPDPDAMSSAIALRSLLGRNKQTTPLFAFKPVTRPENLTMVHMLEIEIQPATTEDLRAFDKIAMVDVQPQYFGDKIPRADIAIDHHPGYPGGAAPFEDVRIKYGATATIMTEYRVTDDDLQAFAHLTPLANYSMLRQIDRPELPLSFAQILARAMKRLVVKDHLVVLNLGTVKRDDLIVQMADFCLQFEAVSWVAVAGKLDGKLVISVRNHGMHGNNAGEAVKSLFADIGSAGGHRNMSKAVIPLRAWRRREGTTRDSQIESRLRELFSAAVKAQAAASRPAGARNGN